MVSYAVQENVSQSSLHCPICRFRISVWCRQATKTNKLVSEKLWKFLQVFFIKTALDFIGTDLV
jgi:hypothetical protein